VSPPFIVEVDLLADLPPVVDCIAAVFALFPGVPLAAGAAVVVEVMRRNTVDRVVKLSVQGKGRKDPLLCSVAQPSSSTEARGEGRRGVSRTTSIGETRLRG
jgi:hypothetical protein